MKLRDFLFLAIKSLKLGKLRSALTVAGLSIGAGALIAVISLGVGGHSMIAGEMKRLGVNRIRVTATAHTGTELDQHDSRLIEASETGAAASAIKNGYFGLKRGRLEMSARVIGCEAVYFDISSLTLTEGRLFSERDMARASAVTVLESDIAERFFGEGGAVGGEISIEGRDFTVIGVVESIQTALGVIEKTGSAYIPYSSMAVFVPGSVPDEIVVGVPGGVREAAQRIVNQLARHKSGSSYTAITMAAEEATTRKVLDIFIGIMASVAAVCLIVGGIGIMNVMLTAVAQRRAQIGVMMALGASPRDIFGQFLAEACLLSALGSALGTVCGIGMTALGAAMIGMDFAAPVAAIAASIAISCLTGVFFGVFPAQKAAATPPMEAIRR